MLTYYLAFTEIMIFQISLTTNMRIINGQNND